MNKYIQKRGLACTLVLCTFLSVSSVSGAQKYSENNTKIKQTVSAVGRYSNWDGVSNVTQFQDEEGKFCFAYNGKKDIVVVKTENGKAKKKKIHLKRKNSLYGGTICDNDGNYYVVTGKKNTTNDTSRNTVFITKYDSQGNEITTIGDNGSSSLADYYDSSFYTKEPFHGGCCDLAINGDYLTVNYAREMYSGHQSNSVWTINVKDMKKVNENPIYNSHSFAQRAIPFHQGFAYVSEGDCYPRAFTVNYEKIKASLQDDQSFSMYDYYDDYYGDDYYYDDYYGDDYYGDDYYEKEQKFFEGEAFHFYVDKGTLGKWDMYSLNNNFAHLGGIAAVDDTNLCLVAASAKSLNKNAKKENENIFIQIFDPTKDIRQESAFVTKGPRTGTGGGNGDQSITDYGVKWLTSADKEHYENPQVASDGKGHIVVFFEEYSKSYSYKGVYYIVLDDMGEVVQKKKCLSKKAMLNPCEMPVYSNGEISWAANKYKDKKNYLYIYRLKLDVE